MFFNLNSSIDDGCTGCGIVLFRSICEDMDVIGIFFFDVFFFWGGGMIFQGGCFE